MGRRRAPRQPRNRAEQAPRASHRGADSFDRLPDELVLALASRLGSARALVCLGQTCRRMHSLMADAHLWRPLCIASHSEFEPPEHFVDFGKNWPWVYRAHIPISHDPPAQSGCSVGTLRRSDFVYRGDLCRAGQHADVNRYVDRHGYGHALWEDGSVYDGEWRDDRPHGRGWYVWPGGVRYDGTWKGGEMHGRGAITYTDGHTYAGRWERGVFDGAGVHTLPDGRQKSCRREGTDWYDVADAADGMDHTDAGDGSPSSAQAATPRTHLAVYGTCMPTRRPTILLSCSRLMLNLAVATLFFLMSRPPLQGHQRQTRRYHAKASACRVVSTRLQTLDTTPRRRWRDSLRRQCLRPLCNPSRCGSRSLLTNAAREGSTTGRFNPFAMCSAALLRVLWMRFAARASACQRTLSSVPLCFFAGPMWTGPRA
ncbi:Morn repeat protein [Pandoravirus inopinatum]|uniref:Morn repeat protein n=1 Tax=Pandoravirus inopinatum TaxID=1605721 RepID=A0A0B5JCX5_9VIRU|nr:Morn repeat protein [Pandoravirus inopinatum]AJF97527.1 Morn repeat protein [Pandoravirus inopinatum]